MNFLDKLIITKTFEFPKERFDLQSHSFYSDGRKSPVELLMSAVEAGYSYISITDHNGIDAYTNEFFDEAKKLGVKVIPGVELECFGELDVLVFDSSENSISKAYKEDISSIVEDLNKIRNKHVTKGVANTISFLEKSGGIPWIKWGSKSENEKAAVISSLELEKLAQINLDTGESGSFVRSYISKPHLAMALAKHDLVDLKLFASTFNIPFEKAPKYAMGMLFDKFIEWPLDSLKPDLDIIERVCNLAHIKIIAHPGKPYERSLESNQGLEFSDYMAELLQKGFDGAEVDYRDYKNPKENYNELTLAVLKNQPKKMYGTGGSDTHSLFS